MRLQKIKTQLKSVFALALTLTMVIPVFAIGQTKATAEETTKYSKISLTDLMKKYPNGKYWNHAPGTANNPDGYSDTPCTHHGTCGAYDGTCGCNVYTEYYSEKPWSWSSRQCFGFAYKLASLCYGGQPHKEWKRITVGDDGTAGLKRVKDAVDNVKPGDIILYNSTPTVFHLLFVYEVNGETLTIADCNYDLHCGIRWGAKVTKSYVKSKMTETNPTYSPEIAVAPYELVFPDMANYATVSLESTFLTLPVGESFSLDAVVSPASAKVTWSSNKASVASVDATGKVTAKAAGTAEITVTTESGNSDSVTINVVQVPATCAESWTVKSEKIGPRVSADDKASRANRWTDATSSGYYVVEKGAELYILAKSTDSSGSTWGFGYGRNNTLKKNIWGWYQLEGETFNFTYPSDHKNSGQIIIEGNKARPGGTVEVTVSLKNNPGISYLSLTPRYDSSILTIESVENGSLIKDMDKSVNYIWSTDKDATADGVLLRMTFRVRDNAPDGEYSVTMRCNEAYAQDFSNVAFSVQGGAISVVNFVYGDVTGDQEINGKDVILLRRYMANYDYGTGTSSVAVDAGADVNGDGNVNGKDVILLRQYMANYNYETGTSPIVLGPRT